MSAEMEIRLGGGILRARNRPISIDSTTIPISSSSVSSSNTNTTTSATPTYNTTNFQRESTRLRSNVADQVQRDLLPAGRLLSVFLVVCELLAEVIVLFATWDQACDRPLRLWILALMALQVANVFLHCLNIFDASSRADSLLFAHRNGLSATDPDMYDGATAPPPNAINITYGDDPATNIIVPSTHIINNESSSAAGPISTVLTRLPFLLGARSAAPSTTSRAAAAATSDVNVAGSSSSSISRPPFGTTAQQASTTTTSVHIQVDMDSGSFAAHVRDGARDSMDSETTRFLASGNNNNSNNGGTAGDGNNATSTTHAHVSSLNERMGLARPECIDQYVRIVNGLYLVWYIFGSIWVSGGGTCSTTAPHLYRLVVALTIIYYALLFLPLACFCLIVCCLPLFILVYRIMLPYAERERRRARAADPALVSTLASVPYAAANFHQHAVGDPSCVICLCDYEPDENILFLPCKHHFHHQCISRWLHLDKGCPLCKQDIDAPGPPSNINISSTADNANGSTTGNINSNSSNNGTRTTSGNTMTVNNIVTASPPSSPPDNNSAV